MNTSENAETYVTRVRLNIYMGADPNNSKSSIHLLRSIKKEAVNEIYLFPPALQPLRCHPELAKITAIVGCVKSITQYTVRKLTGELVIVCAKTFQSITGLSKF